MSRFADFFRRKEPEIDPQVVLLLTNRVEKLGKQLKKHMRDSKKDALDLSLLYDKAQGAVARLRERTKAAKKKADEGLTEEVEPKDALQELRERLGSARARR